MAINRTFEFFLDTTASLGAFRLAGTANSNMCFGVTYLTGISGTSGPVKCIIIKWKNTYWGGVLGSEEPYAGYIYGYR